MRSAAFIGLAVFLAVGVSACGSDDSGAGTAAAAACADRADNDADGLTDYPADPGCASAADGSEADPPPPAACADGLDNDADGKADFPADPGCTSAGDAEETDPVPATACADGTDNDSDGAIDFPADPGCTSASDGEETDPAALPACADGVDNDADGKIDFAADPGCTSAADTDETDPVAAATRTRYAMANQCWAIKAANGNFVVRNASGYTATATAIADAEPFFLKPSALGKYLFYNRNRQLMSVGTAPALTHVASASATDNSEWTVTGVGDTTSYPPTPVHDREPTPAEVSAYRSFVDPALEFSEFTVSSQATNSNLAVDGSGNLMAAAPSSSPANESFRFEPTSGCMAYPEAQGNFSGAPFKGRRADGTVLGHADVHVHIGATDFLGGAQWGSPFHKFGVEHALGSCAVAHGPTGHLDVIGGLLGADVDGHATDGWPAFTDWPSRNNLTHEAIYWKWLERSWAAGLRVAVNDLVDNETLCELQRNATGVLAGQPEVLGVCNEMSNAGEQAGTMYAMQDYIDAQYGGRGQGFFQIVHTPAEARRVVEEGKMAVVLGIEISNLFNCKLHYTPLRTQRPYNETGEGSLLGLVENSYECTVEEGQPNSILTQMQRVWDWGVRQVISIHEFDNAFGGNGIFDGLILNLGNRENSGGIPSGDLADITALLTGQLDPAQVQTIVDNLPTTETATGEWWTTYDCPVEGSTPGFTGYLWGDAGGSVQTLLPLPVGGPLGQDGRNGGILPLYPSGVRQCNARWMTPAGLYTYGKMMELGFLIDWDHMEMGMKTQLLEITEAQNPKYPIVSTHGTFGGTTIDQATRLLRNGGFQFPSNGSSRGFRSDMDETVGIYNIAMAGVAPADRFLFGFGYGTDTNGLSNQTGPRGSIDAGNEIVYPFTLFAGAPFDSLPMFDGIAGVEFQQPSSADADGNVVRTWHQDIDGNAHHGMLSDFVQEIRLEGTPEQMKHLFNSAEAYLQVWQRTQASSAAIQAGGLKTPAEPILRPAPPIGAIAP